VTEAEDEALALPTLTVAERKLAPSIIAGAVRAATHNLQLAASTAELEPQGAYAHLVFARAALSRALATLDRRKRH
jgi:ABC-type molybdate transport system substrate-binding protein